MSRRRRATARAEAEVSTAVDHAGDTTPTRPETYEAAIPSKSQ